MGRLTEMIAYINSSTEDWQKSGGIKKEDFKNFQITPEAKNYRKWYKYAKEGTYQEYLDTKEKK